MVKYTDILKAVNSKLSSKFPTIKIVSESDVAEKIIRPSFMTMIDNIKQEDFMLSSMDKDLTIRIYCFSTERDKNKIENLNMIDSLNELFVEDGQLQLENFNIGIEETTADIVDKVLSYSFDISFNEDYEKDYSNVGDMEELGLDVEVK